MHNVIITVLHCQRELEHIWMKKYFRTDMMSLFSLRGKKKQGEKNTKKRKYIFSGQQALLMCKACQMTYKVKTTSGQHAFLSERWQISRSVQSARFLEEQCVIQGQKKETRDSCKMENCTCSEFNICFRSCGKKTIKNRVILKFSSRYS